MAARRDVFGTAEIAHSDLQGEIDADRYTEGHLMRAARPVIDLQLKRSGWGLDRQILYGHPVCLLDEADPLARDETTGYVGYVTPAHLGRWTEPTHRVTARATLLFRRPDIKTPAPLALSCGSLLHISRLEGEFSCTHDGMYAITRHLCPADEPAADPVAIAETLLGTPYLWGGNSAFGIDCSGLVQLMMQAAGHPCPGDSDQQCDAVGHALPEGTTPARGDLFFWPGHVAIALDAERLIHANAHHMAVAIEPIAAARARIEAKTPLTAHKRL